MLFLSLLHLAQAGENISFGPNLSPILGTAVYRVSDKTDNPLDNDIYRAIRVGGAVGFTYALRQRGIARLLPNISGRTRVLYSRTILSEMVLTDTRLGSFFASSWGPLRFETGFDGIRTENQLPDGYAQNPYFSIATPVKASFDIKVLQIQAVATPLFFTDKDRLSADYSDLGLPGIGDEMEYGIMARLGGGMFGVGFQYTTRLTAYGTDSTIGVGVGL